MLAAPSARVRPLLDAARELVTRLAPLERELLEGTAFRDLITPLANHRMDAFAMNLWTPHLPKTLGGHGLTLQELGHLSEVLGSSPLGHYACNMQAPDAGNMELLAHAATDDQRERWLIPVLRGEVRSCFAMTEPENAGSNPTTLATRAVRDGDDWVINGRKWFTTGADGAGFAIVMAVTDPDAAPHRRATMFVVPTEASGFELVRNIAVMGDRGSDWMSHSEVAFEDCRVPDAHRLGKLGAGFALAQTRLGPGRIHHCMRWIGICERAFALMCQRATTRVVGDGKLADKQVVQMWIAECRARIDGARLMVLDAASRIDEDGMQSARVEISTIKFVVADVLQQVLDRAIQVHGALGMTDDTLLAFWFRHERAARIYDGPDEVHKGVVARHVLAAYGGA